MSESLPETAPLEETAAPSVEESAPGSVEEVVEESARGTQTQMVEASRFNGLMGKFNQTQSALEKARQRIAELEATPVVAQEESVSDVSALQSQVAQLQQMLVEERLDKARDEAIKEFPGAAAFADLIIADTPEAVKEMAKVLHERVSQGQAPEAPAPEASAEAPAPEAEAQAPPVAPAAPQAPQVAGGTSVQGGPVNPEEAVVEAVRKGSFTDFLKAKWDATQAAGDLVL